MFTNYKNFSSTTIDDGIHEDVMVEKNYTILETNIKHHMNYRVSQNKCPLSSNLERGILFWDTMQSTLLSLPRPYNQLLVDIGY